MNPFVVLHPWQAVASSVVLLFALYGFAVAVHGALVEPLLSSRREREERRQIARTFEGMAVFPTLEEVLEAGPDTPHHEEIVGLSTGGSR